MSVTPQPGSFRDPHGFVFTRGTRLLRQVNAKARTNYDLLLSSGLYRSLSEEGALVRHQEVDLAEAATPGAYRVLLPEQLPFISYPYEWSFSQLKDAALLTLRIQTVAVEHGMSLRDATPYNVQFHAGRPIFIDTLSFEPLGDHRRRAAYRQFCEGFLAPLALMSCRDIRLQHLLRAYIDGIPLDLASTLLPLKTRLRPGLAMHVHLHAAAQRKGSTARSGNAARHGSSRLGTTSLLALAGSLERTVRGLEWTPHGTVWADYYSGTNYSDSAFVHKRELVDAAVERYAPGVVWDLGANDGTFSRLAASRGIRVVAFDVDPGAVEKNYRQVKAEGETNVLPLLLDLMNPSGGAGWANRERSALHDRPQPDMLLALALVHHLAIAHNVPLPRVAEYLASLGRMLVIEFVPKDDSQVQRMLASREDIFDDYTQDRFEDAVRQYFSVLERIPVRDSLRTLYVLRRSGVDPL